MFSVSYRFVYPFPFLFMFLPLWALCCAVWLSGVVELVSGVGAVLTNLSLAVTIKVPTITDSRLAVMMNACASRDASSKVCICHFGRHAKGSRLINSIGTNGPSFLVVGRSTGQICTIDRCSSKQRKLKTFVLGGGRKAVAPLKCRGYKAGTAQPRGGVPNTTPYGIVLCNKCIIASGCGKNSVSMFPVGRSKDITPRSRCFSVRRRKDSIMSRVRYYRVAPSRRCVLTGSLKGSYV